MTPSQIKHIFTQMKQGIDIIQLLEDDATTKDYYYFIKAYKLVSPSSFFSYCQLHKFDKEGNDKPFVILLRNILKFHYPPLEYNHSLEDGYTGLDFYVQIAETVFKDA